MSTYDELSRRLDEAESTMRTAEEQLQSFQSVAPQLADLVGRAETADGRVAVEWTAQGMRSLELDPRAMRLPCVDLAAEIQKAVGDAMLDLRDRTRAVFADAGLATAGQNYSLDQVRGQLESMRRLTMDSARRAADDIGRAQRMRQDVDRGR